MFIIESGQRVINQYAEAVYQSEKAWTLEADLSVPILVLNTAEYQFYHH